MINAGNFLTTTDEQEEAPSGSPAGPAVLPPRTLTHAEMNRHIEEGAATSPLYRQDVLRFDDCWWKPGVGGTGWLEVTDPPMIATYDRFAARMTPELAEARRRENIQRAART